MDENFHCSCGNKTMSVGKDTRVKKKQANIIMCSLAFDD